jgi:hypothetical protein
MILILIAAPLIGMGLLRASQASPQSDATSQPPTATAVSPAPSAPATPPAAPTSGAGNRSATPTSQPAGSAASATAYDYIWHVNPPPTSIPDDLQARLVDQVIQMEHAGHLAPLALIGGIGFASGSNPWDLGRAQYGPYTLEWLNPADTITALSQAYPLLPADQQQDLRTYLRAELDAYPIDAFEIGGTYTSAKPAEGSPYFRGTRRERFALPPDLTYNIWPPLNPPIDNLYGLWAYANATGDWDYVRGRWATISALYTSFVAYGPPDSYGQIGGLIGFARIARQLGHDPEAQIAADLAARGLKAGTDFAAFAKTADSRRPNSHALSFAVFSYLTPEVGAYLHDHSRDTVAAYVADATAAGNLPTWYLAWGEQTMGGENAFISPDVAWQIFLARAYILDDTAENLRHVLDQPWAIGDPYFIQKLVATIRASAPIATADSTTVQSRESSAPAVTSPPPQITAFADNRGSFPDSQPPVAEPYEATFHIDGGVWTNPMIPYDAHAPPGVPGETGISVDAHFSNDGWRTSITQPAFLYQDYTQTGMDAQELLIPHDAPVWKIRFAFPSAGVWHLRLTAHDAAGSSQYPQEGDLTITAAPRTSHGFIRVSTEDPRYFVYDDGTTFNPAGYNDSFDQTRFTDDVDAKLSQWQGSGLNLVRLWMSSSNLVGSAWMPWRSLTVPYDGYLPATGLVTDHPDGNIPFTFRLDAANQCMGYGMSGGPALAIQPGHSYQLTVRVRTEAVSPGGSGGFTLFVTNNPGTPCGTDPVPKPLIPSVTGTTDWHTVTTTIGVPADLHSLPTLYLALANAAGAAYVSDITLQDMADPSGTNLITRSPATLLGGFDLAAAWQWDDLLQKMQAQGISAKIVLLEKNDWVYNHLGRDGTPVRDAPAGNIDFYAPPGTPVRAYEEYYWRIVLARWGAYRSVHSWELLNEGDPNSPDHATLAHDFAQFMHANDTARHPVTTSFWAGYPLAFIESAGLDYADIHLYESATKPRPPWQLPAPATIDANPADTQNGHGQSIRLPAGVDGSGDKASMSIHGKGQWTLRVDMRTRDLTGTCPYGAPANLAGPQLLWSLDGGRYAGGNERGTGIVPVAPSGQSFVCSSPSGTHDWQTMSGGFTLDDDNPHLLDVALITRFATSGTAWFDNLSIIAPDGRVLPLLGNGTFDDTTSPSLDLALSTTDVGNDYGALSPAGADMPLIRGETGLAGDQIGQEAADLMRDRDGVWLHTLIWAQLGPGAATNLPWFTASIDANRLWRLFTPYEAFLADIPLAAGGYRDAAATASDATIRVLGQKNPATNRACLWIQNTGFTWQHAVSGTLPPPASGSVSLALAPGAYRVEWWDTTTGAITRVDTVAATSNTLVLTLPNALQTDIAVKVSPIQ